MGEVRQITIRRYGYILFYEVEEPDTIVVLGFWHGRREPGLWETH